MTIDRRRFLAALASLGAIAALPIDATDAEVDAAWAAADADAYTFRVADDGQIVDDDSYEPPCREDLWGLYLHGGESGAELVAASKACPPLEWVLRHVADEVAADRADELDALERAARDREDGAYRSVPTREGGHAYLFVRDQPFAICRALGVKVVEGEHPGSTYYAAELRVPIAAANATARTGSRSASGRHDARRRAAVASALRAFGALLQVAIGDVEQRAGEVPDHQHGDSLEQGRDHGAGGQLHRHRVTRCRHQHEDGQAGAEQARNQRQTQQHARVVVGRVAANVFADARERERRRRRAQGCECGWGNGQRARRRWPRHGKQRVQRRPTRPVEGLGLDVAIRLAHFACQMQRASRNGSAQRLERERTLVARGPDGTNPVGIDHRRSLAQALR